MRKDSEKVPPKTLQRLRYRFAREAAFAYSIVVWYSVDDHAFIARCLEIPGCMVRGARPTLALRRCYDAVADHLVWRRNRGYKLPIPNEAHNLFAKKLHRALAALSRQKCGG